VRTLPDAATLVLRTNIQLEKVVMSKYC